MRHGASPTEEFALQILETCHPTRRDVGGALVNCGQVLAGQLLVIDRRSLEDAQQRVIRGPLRYRAAASTSTSGNWSTIS